MVNVTIENMAIKSRPKNLLQQEKENTPQEETPSSPMSIGQFLDEMGVDWEERGKALYVYPSSLETVKRVIEKMPLPTENQYVIIPLGAIEGYSVFVMITRNSTSIRIGYGRNSIPFSPVLFSISEKLTKVMKEIGIETKKNGRNLLGV